MSLADFLIYLAGLIWGIELIPQVIKTYKLKDVKGVSLTFFIMCLFVYFIYTIGNVMKNNWVVVIAHIPSLIGNLIMVSMIVRYKNVR